MQQDSSPVLSDSAMGKRAAGLKCQLCAERGYVIPAQDVDITSFTGLTFIDVNHDVDHIFLAVFFDLELEVRIRVVECFSSFVFCSFYRYFSGGFEVFKTPELHVVETFVPVC